MVQCPDNIQQFLGSFLTDEWNKAQRHSVHCVWCLAHSLRSLLQLQHIYAPLMGHTEPSDFIYFLCKRLAN
jgi:hypothetical protein